MPQQRNDRVLDVTLLEHETELRFHAFDLAGHETARRLWQDYGSVVDGIVRWLLRGAFFPRAERRVLI